MKIGKYAIKCQIIGELSERGKRCYKVYNKLIRLRWFIGNDMLYDICIPLLGKMVEMVVNETIVQYLRMRMGVKMPDYFMKFDDTLGSEMGIKTTKRLTVKYNRYFFNNLNEIRLKGISVGELADVLHSLKYRRQCCDENDIIWIMDDNLHTVLKKISKLRGEAMHGTEEITEEYFEFAIRNIQWIFDEYGERMLQIKRRCFSSEETDKKMIIHSDIKRQKSLYKWMGGVPECSREFTEVYCSSLDYLVIRRERLVAIDKYIRRLNDKVLIERESFIIEDGWTEMKEDSLKFTQVHYGML